MNAYWYPQDEMFGPCIRLQDHFGEYLLSLRQTKVYLLFRYEDRVFAGVASGSEREPAWSITADYPSAGEPAIIASVGTSDARDVSESVVAQEKGQYLGRIDCQPSSVRFVPAAAAPEEAIPVLRHTQGGKIVPERF